MNVVLSQVGIYGVQSLVECERHNPIGVVRTFLSCLEMGEGSVSYTLFVLVYALGRHVSSSPVGLLWLVNTRGQGANWGVD